MTISVVICTSRRPSCLKDILISLSPFKEEFEELLIVVNGLPDYSSFAKELLQQNGLSGTVTYSSEANVNNARNIGAKKSYASHILFLDDDCTIEDSNFFKNIKQFVSENPNVSICGGAYQISPKQKDSLAIAYQILSQAWVLSGELNRGENFHLLGGCLIVSSRVFEDGLWFDERIGFGGSETEFLKRAVHSSFECRLVPNLTVRHNIRLTTSSFISKAKKQARHSKKKSSELNPDKIKFMEALQKRFIGIYSKDRKQMERVFHYIDLYNHIFYQESENVL